MKKVCLKKSVGVMVALAMLGGVLAPCAFATEAALQSDASSTEDLAQAVAEPETTQATEATASEADATPVATVSETEVAYLVEGGYIYFDTETGVVTAADDAITNADIPAEIAGVPVVAIGDCAFTWCAELTSVTLPDGLRYIYNDAFSRCTSLSSINLPDGLEYLDSNVFYKCESLTELIIPDSVSYIGAQAFYDCTKLTSVNIPDGITAIEQSTFNGCKSLVSIDIPSSVQTMGYYAFYNCDSITSIVIPDGVTSIPTWAFAYCDKLSDVTLPDSITEINYMAFTYCNSLQAITIPDSVTYIGDSAFRSCNGLLSITIPSSVQTIDKYAFAYCDDLTNVIIEEGVTTIGRSAFRECPSLLSIAIPEGVTVIDTVMFYNCTSLTSIYLPTSVVEIGGSAFSECTSFTTVYYAGTESQWKKISIDYSFNDALKNADVQYNYLPATGVSLSQTVLAVGYSAQAPITIYLTASVTPSSATNQVVTWGSSDTSVASVTEDGAVSIHGVGVATITVTAPESWFVATAEITVLDLAAVGTMGDITGEGVVSVHDAVQTAQAALNAGESLSATTFIRADINVDGNITQDDVAQLLKEVLASTL